MFFSRESEAHAGEIKKTQLEKYGESRASHLGLQCLTVKSWLNIIAVPMGAPNNTEKQKNHLKYPELKGLTFHTFPMDDRRKTYTPGMNENERRKRWIAACRLSSLNVTRHTRICSAHFEGGLGPTKLNPVPTIFSFPTHLQPRNPTEANRSRGKKTRSFELLTKQNEDCTKEKSR